MACVELSEGNQTNPRIQAASFEICLAIQLCWCKDEHGWVDGGVYKHSMLGLWAQQVLANVRSNL
jgi:hypothetical protein